MLYNKLKELINDYPKINKVCQEMISNGYFITSITTTSMSPVKQLDYTNIEIIMGNDDGDRILLNYTEGIVNVLTVEEISSVNEKMHDNLLLNKQSIHNKQFKKRLFGGYDTEEVDNFLDLIIKNYTFIEQRLIKEIHILKEDLEKLRGLSR